jgi:glycosyltransferase involved in cell wall biosynthesis
MIEGASRVASDEVVISLVIPAHNESRYLPRLLDSVDAARDRFRGGTDAVEVIVADNGSTDDTAAVAMTRGCRTVKVEERRIASARNGGAAVATGDILCFVDADSEVHPETFNAVECCLAAGRVVAGASGVRMERWSPGIAVTYALFMPLVWLLRMDTGVVFCRRRDFEAIGGYDERRYFGEDVQLLLDLRRLGRGRGQRLTRLRTVKALGSTRKFDLHGDWHYLSELVHLVPKMLWMPGATNDFAQRYWYGEQRTQQNRDES